MIVKGVMAAARTKPCSQISTGLELDCALKWIAASKKHYFRSIAPLHFAALRDGFFCWKGPEPGWMFSFIPSLGTGTRLTRHALPEVR